MRRIYSSSFNVRESDFEDFTRSFTGAQAGKMYLWLMDSSSIDDKLEGYSLGKALITVTLENGKSFKADDFMYFG
ncbi:MAG TPA: hypothetical protein VGQ03_08680 [Nitrososphaera sp.]|jgi:hypothetical protein|nr:hypothetical protein [Nitrososphaera sp.]